jgi:hypothetical protein
MVKKDVIRDEEGKGFTVAIESTNIERIDPISHYKSLYVENKSTILRIFLLGKNPPFPGVFLEPFISQEAEKDWQEHLDRIMAEEVPPLLFSVLKTRNKKHQEKFLRGMAFTPDQLEAFFYRAYSDYGYTLSIYSSEFLPSDIDEKDMPRLAYLEDNKIKKTGATTISDGKIKQAIEQRSAIYAKILDNGDAWHCFFITIESIAGKENWKVGQPHYHYISDAFGLSREEVVKQLKSKNYQLFNLPHIELLGYGEQPKIKK